MPPPIVTRSTGWRARYFSSPPAKSPMSSIACSGRPCRARTAASEVAPVQPATWRSPPARATSMPRWIEAIQAAQEKGRTTPVVPRIDSPPSMPSRGFQVRAAMAAPPGIETVTRIAGIRPCRSAASAITPRIISRGTGLIAGSPGGIGRPGRVTVPTPSPAAKPRPGSARAITRQPWVTSGSSPASLTTPASAQPSPEARCASAKRGVSPRGSAMVTASGNAPPQRRSSAAASAAVAQAPVVQPRRSGSDGLRGEARVTAEKDRRGGRGSQPMPRGVRRPRPRRAAAPGPGSHRAGSSRARRDPLPAREPRRRVPCGRLRCKHGSQRKAGWRDDCRRRSPSPRSLDGGLGSAPCGCDRVRRRHGSDDGMADPGARRRSAQRASPPPCRHRAARRRGCASVRARAVA